jgi:hypothetical protein
VKLAYFVSLHHKPAQFRWLFDAIYSDSDLFCIHIDAKAPPDLVRAIQTHVGVRPNVTFLPRRRVNWGGWSQVRVELDAIRHLVGRGSWHYYVNLSGQDYPLQSRHRIRERLREAWPRNFIRVWPFSLVRRLQPDDPHLRRDLCIELGSRVFRTRLRLPFPTKIDVAAKGAQWHCLTREFCCWLLETPLRAQVARHVRFTLVPDELFFQAMIVNGPFRETRCDYAREIVWPGPKVLGMEDYERLSRSDALFGRKFDEAHDGEVLLRLAARNGYRAPAGVALAA